MHTRGSVAFRSSSTTDLVAAVARGDPDAWAEVLARYGPMVEARIRSFRLQAADALDAQQATWLRLTQYAARLHTPEHLGGWLSTVATRECLAILRFNRARHADDDAVARVPDQASGPERCAIESETRRMVQAAVGDLSQRRQVLVLSLFANKPQPYAELSSETGIPIGSIGPTRARALTALRRALEEQLTA